MRLCLNMIVKNEVAVIDRCLRSVLAHVDCWAIADTGSTDGTQDRIRQLLGHLPGELIERPWVDFASNRNEALALARRHGDYALIIDADDVFEVDAGRGFGGLDGPGYALEIVDRHTNYWRDALVRLDLDWTWEGVVHEHLTCSQLPGVRKLGGARIRRIGGGARSQGDPRDKYRRDVDVLRRALVDEPGNARHVFYLAQSLRDAGQPAEAIDVYRQRVDMGGWVEEVYFSKFMIARLRQQLGHPFDEVVAAYLDAHRFRPARAEPACFLAQYLRMQGRHAEACDYARIACATPPSTDSLRVHRPAYGWLARYELAAALYALQDYAACIAVSREMLADPLLPPGEAPRVRQNIAAATAMAARPG
ncbi:glycosyltransferase [Rudaea sp.]|uniref:glycosyltransferase n=1 Tax=Rudaea sp. TaxID=2136325 RepID=UPI00322039C9